MVPPPLAWLQAFCDSTGLALDQQILFEWKKSVNPLVYTVKFTWAESISGNFLLQVWNLLQKWLIKNDCIPNGVSTSPTSITLDVGVKRRFGSPKDESPLG